MARGSLAGAAVVLVLAAAGCGRADAGDAAPDTPVSSGAICVQGVLDCDDAVVVDDPGAIDGGDFDADSAMQEAGALLGLAEDDLPAAVRVGRRDGEHMALTEDYVLGRHTAELDSDAAGVARVTAVVTELPEGPVTTTTR